MSLISTQYEYALDLLDNLLTESHSALVTLVICHERSDFLLQVVHQVKARHDALHHTQAPSSSEMGARDASISPLPVDHLFKTPTLQLLAASRRIKLVFCPSLPALRAHLSVFTDTASTSKSRLILLDLVALHHSTSDFNLQGLSKTFASVVSAAHSSPMALWLMECKDIHDPRNPHRGPVLWETQVPLLSGSIKLGQEGARWAGRAITIKKIASRWFTFENRNSVNPRIRPGMVADDGVDKEMFV